MSILSTNTKLIKVGQEYSAGSGISIDDYVISVTATLTGDYASQSAFDELSDSFSSLSSNINSNSGVWDDVVNKLYISSYHELSAGANINITDYVVSSKDWTNEIANASANAFNAATAQIPTPFDPAYLSAQIDNKLNESDFTNWQNGQYSTDLQTIEGQINNKLDSSSFSDVSGNFLTAINLPESATWNDTSDVVKESSASWNQGKTYEGISPIVVNNDENKVSAETWTFSAGSNVSFVDDDVNKITRIDVELPTPQDLSYISAQVDSANQGVDYLSGVVITALPSDMATTGDIADLAQSVSETYYPNTNPSSFVNEDWVTAQGYITGVDLSEYAERAFVLSSIESATSGKLDVSSFASVSSDFLTNEDLNGYATESFVQNVSADITALIPSDYATNTQINELSGAIDYVSANVGGVISSYTTATIEGVDVVNSLNGKALISFRAASAQEAGIANNAKYDYEGNNLVDDHNSMTALNDFVQSNSAQWGQGGGEETISSYTTVWSPDVPPYGKEVINSLNGLYLSANNSKLANSASIAGKANSANSAGYAQTVNETYLENQGFTRNLSSEYGTISVVHNNLIESTNSAIVRTGYEGFVSAFGDKTIGPELTATFNWDKSLPNTTFNFKSVYASDNTKIAYSANTNLTGEVTVTAIGEIPFSVDVPNATSLNVWSTNYIQIKDTVASADDTFETVVGELAWASALPTYEYDSSNKISAINGSAIAAGDEFPISADEAIQYVQTNSAQIDDTVTSYQTNSGTFLTAHQAISANEWNSNYETVNTNSGAWGGQQLPISAGPGISLQLIDNVLVISTASV